MELEKFIFISDEIEKEKYHKNEIGQIHVFERQN